ncbi:hypothetical protein EX217_11485 [Providencia rettgeri]|uniref:hypothetical protein n=1 Tax=Providencia TaxID=586 RepID=UPI001C82D569|nr:hypothetical protein [Providencia rettgeri]EJD6540345.1 hypothetical protein [Providencia rettgeri]ELR5188209.1 hypothetical protein [Providencia rettgeri]MBX6969982.1 hypothetical protein [Providencia rettgeri]MBX6978231.1 hypothetical protein [Providencia rettgeri]MBX6995286.1 hypothetical protein [Providencia rettgeri]
MKLTGIFERLHKCIEALNKHTDELPSISKRVSSVASNLAAYTVVNGLIFLIAIKASCKLPEFQGAFYHASAFFIGILFFLFINDVFTNYFPLKPIKHEKLSFKLILVYLAIIGGTMAITWLYVASVYQPLFSIPDGILECKK